MSKGLDCSTALTTKTAQLFANQGHTFVGRYLADKNSWKRLTPTEAQIINDAGMYIISFMERYSNRVAEGACSGTEDGKLGLQYAKEVLQPEGTPIYFCVDYDAQSCDYDAIEAYLRAADNEIIGYELGVYGSYTVVKEMYERGVCKKIAQTVAWSRGKRYENANFYQAQIDVTVNSVGIDIDETNGDAGGWKIDMVIENKISLSVDDANQILAILGQYWNSMDGNVDAQNFTHYLGDQIRIASGQPVE